MNLKLWSAALIAAVFVPSLAFADFIKDGVYEGSTSSGSGMLRVIIDGADVGVRIMQQGCLGMVEGALMKDKSGQQFLVTDMNADDRCTIAFRPHGAFSFSLEQGRGCSAYHGASCGFSGFVERVR